MKNTYDKVDRVETPLGNAEILTQPDEFGRCKVKFDLPCDEHGTVEMIMTTFQFGKHLFEDPSQPDKTNAFDHNKGLHYQYKQDTSGLTYEQWLEKELLMARQRFNTIWDD